MSVRHLLNHRDLAMMHHPRAGHDAVRRVTDPRRATPVSDIGNVRHQTEDTRMSAGRQVRTSLARS